MTCAARLAHSYASESYRVLPICWQSKRPLIQGSFKAASSDHVQISQWWKQWPNAMTGLATSRFWTLDVDLKGVASVADVLGDLANLADKAGLVVQTPSGGHHYYFARTAGVAVPPRGSDIKRSIDTRGHGPDGEARSYIIAPGSTRADGRRYEIVRGALDEISTAPHRLLALAHFGKRERDMIAADAALKAAINAAAPNCWRGIFDEHQRKVAANRAPVIVDLSQATGLRRQALSDLHERAARLASASDNRKAEVFRAAAAIGKYAAIGPHVLRVDEITSKLMDAWHACGAAAKHGPRYGAQQIAAGLKISSDDPPPLVARRFRDPPSQAQHR